MEKKEVMVMNLNQTVEEIQGAPRATGIPSTDASRGYKDIPVVSDTEVLEKATRLELSRKYNISPVIISRWKKQYYSGKFFENKSTDYARFEIRIKELERMVGRLTMENDTLKEIIKLVEPQKNRCRRYLHRQTGKR